MHSRRGLNLACVVALAAVFTGGCGSSSGGPAPTTASKPATAAAPVSPRRAAPAGVTPSTKHQSPPANRRVAQAPAKPVSRPAKSPAPAAKPKAVATPMTVGRARSWSGTGDKVLGTVTLKQGSLVRWTSAGGRFTLGDVSHSLNLTGTADNGQNFVKAGTYDAVSVTTAGRWTLTVAPLYPAAPAQPARTAHRGPAAP